MSGKDSVLSMLKICVYGMRMAQHRAVHTRRKIAEVATPLQGFATPWQGCEAKSDPKI